ncbi:uncharacterized protein LOC124630714 [Helicoverpa zea]|uniref:uncharacterized protein LOC124630714 n=1 Tax=Helicoverpa zea TaxID=7113 RepID=UPI001F59AE43|nr:uncharacterized protein LOC124630714 [Helicoverpa zea]
MVYMAFASLGYNILPLLMASELYPLQVRGVLNGITVSITSLLIFGTTKSYPLLADNLGLMYTMIVFGVCSLLGTIFLYFFLPETKELTLQEIEEYYNELRPTLVSQRRLLTSKIWESSHGRIKSIENVTEANPEKPKKVIIKSKDVIKIEDESYLKKYAKSIELQKSSRERSKLSVKSKESLIINESNISIESLKSKKHHNTHKHDKHDKKVKVLEDIKETGRSNESIKSNQSKASGTSAKAKKDKKEDEKEDENQPNTSKKDTHKE